MSSRHKFEINLVLEILSAYSIPILYQFLKSKGAILDASVRAGLGYLHGRAARNDYIPLVFIWALIALIVKNSQYALIKYTSVGGIILLASVVGYKLIKVERLSY